MNTKFRVIAGLFIIVLAFLVGFAVYHNSSDKQYNGDTSSDEDIVHKEYTEEELKEIEERYEEGFEPNIIIDE